MDNFNQTGGIGFITSSMYYVAQGFFLLLKLIVNIITYIIRVAGIYILKFFVFCLVSSIALSFFSFFGVIFTFFAIIILYFKIFQKLRKGDSKFIDAFNQASRLTSTGRLKGNSSTGDYLSRDTSIGKKLSKLGSKLSTGVVNKQKSEEEIIENLGTKLGGMINSANDILNVINI
jgi:hypothetical protein